MRRLVPELPIARSAIWTRRFATVGAVLAIAAVVVPRHGVVTPALALVVLELGLAAACLAFPCGLVAMVVIWRTGWRGVGRTILGILVACLVLAYPAFLGLSMGGQFPAADLSTNPADPPPFTKQAPLADTGGLGVGGWDLAWFLGTAGNHDEPAPVLLDEKPAEAYKAALKVAKILRWRVISASAPGAGPARIEAVAASAVMRLPENVAIRIVERDGQTRVDVRSAFRLSGLPLVGGDNLRNIQSFSDALEDQAAEN